MEHTSRLPGFYRRPLPERRAVLVERFGLSPEELRAFELAGGLSLEVADKMVENAVGVLGLPLGLALNFVVDDEPVVVPMAIEEPSVVAACSYVARLASEGGGFTTDVDPPVMIAQVQLLDVADARRAAEVVEARREEIMALADQHADGLRSRGGGCVGVEARVLAQLSDGPHADLDDGGDMLVVHLLIDCRDAMGANAVNTVAEGVAPRLEELTGGRACLRILSNLADRRCARATMRIPYRALEAGERSLGRGSVPPPPAEVPRAAGRDVARGIVEAYRLAARDPYRAATHNKGIMNGVDAVAVATGNDWRSLEAGAHAFAARSGRYTSLTRFWLDDDAGCLMGSIEMPLAVGVVGGSTRVHPTVSACRKLLGPFGAAAGKLAGLMAAVGLAQNTGALRALATEGIQRGHMALHARQVALAAGASDDEVDVVASRLVCERCIKPARAEEVLGALRATTGTSEAAIRQPSKAGVTS